MAKVEPYRLDPSYEQKLIVAITTQPRVFGKIGAVLEPEALGLAPAINLAKAVRAVAKDLGRGPSDQSVVLQRLRRWVDDGVLTQAEVSAAIDYLIEAPRTLPSAEELIGEIAPILRRRMEANAVRMAMDEYAKRGDFSTVEQQLQRARAVGQVDTSGGGLELGDDVWDEIAAQRIMDRLPTGILELDMLLEGGLPRGCQGVYVAPPGAGKSMFLNHVTAAAARRGYFCAVASLEVNRAVWMARLMANLTGEPIAKILALDVKHVRSKIDRMFPLLGTVIIEDFPAKLTSMLEITQWVDALAQKRGYMPQVFAVDYADKCKSHVRSDDGEYSAQGTVYETQRLFAHKHAIWAWTASQPVRKAGKEKGRRIELDDLADSQHKARVADLVVTGKVTDNMIEYTLAKFRHGRGVDQTVGPLPHDWDCGRMTLMEDGHG